MSRHKQGPFTPPPLVVTSPSLANGTVTSAEPPKPVELEPEIAAHIDRLRTDAGYRARIIAEIRAEKAARAFVEANNPKARPYVEGGPDDPRFFLPKDKPLPEKYIRGNVPPCPKCRAIGKRNGVNAVKQLYTNPTKNTAHFVCNVCKKEFAMDIGPRPY